MCDEAVSLITKSIGELDAASLFAAAGQLELEGIQFIYPVSNPAR